jgi:hypothetical protein
VPAPAVVVVVVTLVVTAVVLEVVLEVAAVVAAVVVELPVVVFLVQEDSARVVVNKNVNTNHRTFLLICCHSFFI